MLDNDKWKMHTAYVQENKSIYLSLYEDLFENGCVYIYIYIFLRRIFSSFYNVS